MPRNCFGYCRDGVDMALSRVVALQLIIIATLVLYVEDMIISAGF